MVPDPADHDRPGRWSGVRSAASRLDTEPRLLAAVRSLRRRLPGDEKFGDPLTAAGASSAALVARGLAALRPEGESALGEVGLAALQLWQSVSERAGRGRGDRDLALLYTDLVDFSRFALAAGDAAAVDVLLAVARVVEAAVEAHGGQIDKRLGDGVLATFPDAAPAVAAALDAQDAVAGIEVGGYRPRMRVGVHWGRPRTLGGELLGVDVSVAARVGEAARGGQVLVSGAALARLDAGGESVRIGRRKRLRQPGAPQELHVAAVRRRSAEDDEPRRSWRRRARAAS